METFFDYAALVCGLLVIILILIQTRGASLGAGLGGGGGESGSTVRRGSEKTIHQITIILVVCFAVSLIAGFLV